MAHFAELDNNNLVIRVIVAEQNFIDSGAVGDPQNWIQTSYNTYEGIHRGGGVPLRKNYAAPGFFYDKALDAFIPPKPFDSWTLDEKTGTWKAPKDRPDNGTPCMWDEKIGDWVGR